MNRVQLVVLWLVGISVSSIIGMTGYKLLVHAANFKETWENGYPLTLLAGTVWTYIIPIIVMGGILIYSTRGLKGKRTKGGK